MKPLSTLKFIKGSGRKLCSLVISVSLAVALLYFLSLTISHIIDQNIELNVAPLANMSVLSGTSVKVTKEDLDKDLAKLKGNKYIKGCYITSLRYINLKTNASNNDMLLFLLEDKDIASVMKWEKLELTQGRMPQKPGEILLNAKLAANYSLKLDDVVKKSTKGWDLNEDVKVVGIIGGPAIMGFQYVDENSLMLGKQSISVITVAEDAAVSKMNGFIEANFGSRYEVRTLDIVKKVISEKNKNFNVIMIFVGVIVVIVLNVLLGNICMIQYTQRSKEFELLHAIGYTKKNIASKVFKEIGVSTTLGCVIGIVIAMIFIWLMNIFLLDEKLSSVPLVNFNKMLCLLLVPLLVTLSGMLTPMKILKFRDIM